MTRPIYEPSPDRKDASLQYGSNQLFRRPAPIGVSGAAAYAVMNWQDGADIPDDTKTIVNLAQTGASWTEGYINPAGLALATQPFAFDFDEGKITFRSSGLYHAQATVNWADTFPTPGPSYLDTILEYFGDCPLSTPCGDWSSSDVMFNNQDWMQQWQQSVGHVVSIEDPDNDSWFRVSVIQKSDGTNKFLSGATLIVTKLAGFDADTGEFFPPAGT